MKNERKNLKTQVEIMRIGNLYKKQSINLMALLEEYFLLHPEDLNPVKLLSFMLKSCIKDGSDQSKAIIPDLSQWEDVTTSVEILTTYEVVLLLKCGYNSRKKITIRNLPDLYSANTLMYSPKYVFTNYDSLFMINDLNNHINIGVEIRSLKLVKLYLMKNPDPLFEDGFSLLIAAYNGYGDILSFLLGANFTIHSDVFLTNLSVLNSACKGGQIEIVKFYLKNYFQINKYGSVVLHECFLNAVHSRKVAICELLVESGFDFNSKFHLYMVEASYKSCFQIINFLTNYGQKSRLLSEKDLYTALYLSASNGNLRIVKYLIFIGADKQKSNTVLQYAIEADQYHVADFLISNGYDIMGMEQWDVHNKHVTYKQECYVYRLIVEKYPIKAKEYEFYLSPEMKIKYAEWLTAGDFNMI